MSPAPRPALEAAIERLTARLRHHPACFHEGLAVWNRDEETCDCGLMADLALLVAAAQADHAECERSILRLSAEIEEGKVDNMVLQQAGARVEEP